MKLKTAVAIALLLFVITVGAIMIINGLHQSDSPASSADQSSSDTQSRSVTFAAEEIARHNGADDCWIIIEGDVYDVTGFIASHPGGADRIINQCGKDATTPFETQDGRGGHSAMARSQLNSYRIGTLGAGE